MSDKKKSNNIVVQFTRLTHAERLADRFLTSQVYKPADPENARQEIIFSQIEILNPWFPTSQIGQTIINTAIREYYRGDDTSELNNLEIALKKINETLAQISQKGETDWIGNLHGIIILINGLDIHISQTGQTQAYLFRGAKINHITEGLFDDGEPHPLRTFSNITSGTLHPHDKIVIANPTFFEVIDLDTVKQIVIQNPPAIAAQEFAAILKHNKGNSGEALILEMTTKQEESDMPLEYKVDTIYLDKGIVPSWMSLKSIKFPKISRKQTSAAHKPSKIQSSLTKIDESFDKHITPVVHNVAKKTYHIIKKGGSVAWQKISQSKVGQKISSSDSSALQSIRIHLMNFWAWFVDKITFGNDDSPSKRARYYGIWGAGLLIALIIIILISRQPANKQHSISNADLQQQTSDLGERFNKVKLSAAYNDKTVALQDLGSIFSDIAAIEAKQELLPSLEELKKQAIEELGSLTNAKTPSTTDSLADWGDYALLLAYNDNGYAEADSSITKIPGDTKYTLNDRSMGNILSSDIDETGKTIAILSFKGLSLVNITKGTTAVAKLESGSWIKSDHIVYFDDNIYALDVKNGTIQKYQGSDNSFDAGKDYGQPEGDELKNTADIAVNGNILAILHNGNIIKYSKTGRTPIEYSQLPAENFIKDPQSLFADSNSTDIAILHKDAWVSGLWRLSVFTRTGKYKNSYFIPEEYSNFKAFDYDSVKKTIWLATDKIYELKLE